MSKYDQALPEGSTTLILVEFYSIPRRRNSCQPSARGKFVFSISLSSRFGLCNLCVYLEIGEFVELLVLEIYYQRRSIFLYYM